MCSNAFPFWVWLWQDLSRRRYICKNVKLRFKTWNMIFSQVIQTMKNLQPTLLAKGNAFFSNLCFRSSSKLKRKGFAFLGEQERLGELWLAHVVASIWKYRMFAPRKDMTRHQLLPKENQWLVQVPSSYVLFLRDYKWKWKWWKLRMNGIRYGWLRIIISNLWFQCGQ